MFEQRPYAYPTGLSITRRWGRKLLPPQQIRNKLRVGRIGGQLRPSALASWLLVIFERPLILRFFASL